MKTLKFFGMVVLFNLTVLSACAQKKMNVDIFKSLPQNLEFKDRILKFFAERNKSKAYSAKLYKKINQEIQILKKFPNIGFQTDFENVRGLIS
jgi:L-asparaginase/Glu-tRNA(Gln) amidotransferase subunit D